MNNKEKAQLFIDRWVSNPNVYGRQWISKPDENGNSTRGFSPTCENFWTPKCHIKLKDGVSCSKCEIKKYAPITTDSVLKHITGVEQQIMYSVSPEGLCKYAAIDFDFKEGKEHLGYKFEDVKKAITVLQSWGIPYAAARSTGQGFHLYIFFSELVSAVKARSVLNEVFFRCGFIQESLQNIRPIPEMFPKQGHINNGLGNGIKPPMIEPNFARERNCLVTDDNQMIPAQVQWDYLKSVARITAADLDALLERESIPLMEDIVTGKSNKAGRAGGMAGRAKWQKPLSGSFEKVLEGCAAFRRVKSKCLKGQAPGHFEGMAMWHAAIHTADGQDWFMQHTGWGQDQNGMRQLEHSIEKDYSPWTCKKMQENGVCVPGTKCFEKKPPVDWAEGLPVVRDDIPKDQWPEPSPIRFAFSSGEDYLQKLIQEVAELADEPDEERRTSVLAEIIRRGLVFDSNQQELLKKKIEEHNLAKRAFLNKQFKEAHKQKENEFVEAASERGDSILINGISYRKLNPRGFALFKMGGASDKEAIRVLTDFDMEITEERIVVEDEKTQTRVYVGKITAARREYKFEIDTGAWIDNTEFSKYFSQLCGSDFNVMRIDLDAIKQVVLEYRKEAREHTSYYSTCGWYESTYLTPSVLSDRDSVRPNTEKRVDLRNKGAVSNVDFKLLSSSELRDVLFHIKSELFNTFDRQALFMGLGHTMMAGIHSYLDVRVRPTLWYEGDSGNGKTQLTIMLSRFYGSFNAGLAWGSSVSSMFDYAYQFRDSLLLVDDFKGDSPQRTQAAKDTVQFGYDGNAVGKMTRSGTQRGDRKSRCLFMMTGEETPVNHASVIARMCLINYPKFDTSKTKELFAKCQVRSDDYRGVTPYFIHWILNQERDALQEALKTDSSKLKEAIKGTQNDDRVAENVGLALTGFKLFVYFLLSNTSVSKQEADDLIAEATTYACVVRDNMSVRCAEEKNGNILINRLRELLLSKEAQIENLEGFYDPMSKATIVGFVVNADKEPHVGYLYPGTVLTLIKSSMHDNLVASPQSIGTQLKAMGLLVRMNPGRHQYQKRYKTALTPTWCVNLEKLGITSDGETPLVVGQTTPMVLQPPVDAQGLI